MLVEVTVDVVVLMLSAVAVVKIVKVVLTVTAGAVILA